MTIEERLAEIPFDVDLVRRHLEEAIAEEREACAKRIERESACICTGFNRRCDGCRRNEIVKELAADLRGQE